MGKRSELSANERREAVLRLLRREEPGAVLARRYGVGEATLYRWRDEFLAAGEAVLAGGTRNGAAGHERQIAELERQIEKRDQVIGELTIANRVLKKLSGPSS
jgi:transposase